MTTKLPNSDEGIWLARASYPGDPSRTNQKIDIAKVDYFWMGIRGTSYYQQALKRAKSSTFATLVPQLNNPHDNTAIEIQANNSLIGYVPRMMAHTLYSQIGFLKLRGHSLRISVHINHNVESSQYIGCPEYSAWACIPTHRGINKLAPLKDLKESFQPLWDSLPEDLRDTIARDSYHLTSETGPQVWKNRHSAPNFWISRSFDKENIDLGVNLALQSLREERRRTEQLEKKKRDKQIIRMNESGLPNKKIAERLAISSSTVRKILKDSGRSAVKNKPTGINATNIKSLLARAEKCLLAADRQSEGISRAAIAKEMNTSLKSVEKYLTDGKFYRDMSRNSRRKDAIIYIRKNGNLGSYSEDELRRARNDSVIADRFNLQI